MRYSCQDSLDDSQLNFWEITRTVLLSLIFGQSLVSVLHTKVGISYFPFYEDLNRSNHSFILLKVSLEFGSITSGAHMRHSRYLANVHVRSFSDKSQNMAISQNHKKLVFKNKIGGGLPHLFHIGLNEKTSCSAHSSYTSIFFPEDF